MEKSKLQSFISRYYLAGNCEAVKLNENANGVSCELIDMDQTVVGKIQWNTTRTLNAKPFNIFNL